MRSLREHGELIQKVVDPGPFGEQRAVGSWIWQINVPGFDARLGRVRARELAALGRDGNDRRQTMRQRVDNRWTIRGVLDQDRAGGRIRSVERFYLPAALAETPLPFHAVDHVDIGAVPTRDE